LLNGRSRIFLDGDVSNTLITNNRMEMRAIGTDVYGIGGFVRDSSNTRDTDVNFHLYMESKFTVGETVEDDSNMHVGVGTHRNIEITTNALINAGQGVMFWGGADGIKIHHNTMARNFSQGAYLGDSIVNLEINDNLFYDNGRYDIRHNHSTASSLGPHYIYRNRFWGKDNGSGQYAAVGTPIGLFDFSGQSNISTETWIYHNSFAGTFTNYSTGSANQTRAVNNVHSSDVVFDSGGPANFKSFDYNWGLPGQGFSGTNLVGSTKMWSDITLPDFILPAGSTARSTGIDLSRPFVLRGVTYPAFPGMSPGYFSGTRPNIGAVQ